MFGEAWSPMSVPDLAPDDDDDINGSLYRSIYSFSISVIIGLGLRMHLCVLN